MHVTALTLSDLLLPAALSAKPMEDVMWTCAACTKVTLAVVGLVLAAGGAWAQNQPNQPSSSQVYQAVIMPTQNCERANTSRPANWQYDCSRWCKSFTYYNKVPNSPSPQLPAICAKYMRQQTR